jgi:hypothetical protein
MNDRKPHAETAFPTPMVANHRTERKSLNLDEADLSKDGVQGDVVVSKGRASTFAAAIPKSREKVEADLEKKR